MKMFGDFRLGVMIARTDRMCVHVKYLIVMIKCVCTNRKYAYDVLLTVINLLNPCDCFTYQQVLTFKNSTWCSRWVMCFVRSHNRLRLLPYKTSADWFCKTEVENVYCAVRTQSVCKTDTYSL
jgi:hypothetical protein